MQSPEVLSPGACNLKPSKEKHDARLRESELEVALRRRRQLQAIYIYHKIQNRFYLLTCAYYEAKAWMCNSSGDVQMNHSKKLCTGRSRKDENVVPDELRSQAPGIKQRRS